MSRLPSARAQPGRLLLGQPLGPSRQDGLPLHGCCHIRTCRHFRVFAATRCKPRAAHRARNLLSPHAQRPRRPPQTPRSLTGPSSTARTAGRSPRPCAHRACRPASLCRSPPRCLDQPLPLRPQGITHGTVPPNRNPRTGRRQSRPSQTRPARASQAPLRRTRRPRTACGTATPRAAAA